MAKFLMTIDTYASATYEIEAENADEAEEKMQTIIDGENFFNEYRKQCDFFEPAINDTQEV